jgi:hypothetical protein
MLKEVPLRTVSGQQARAAAEQDAQAAVAMAPAPATASAAPTDVAPLATRAESSDG